MNTITSYTDRKTTKPMTSRMQVADEGFEESIQPDTIAMNSNLFSTCEPLRKRVTRRYRKSRPRRRKGKLQSRVPLPDQNGNSWRYSIGAPRNDNEFLLNQSIHGCFQETNPETAFPYATSDDETETCPICHHTEPRKDSGVESEGETTSDNASSPVDRNGHVCLPSELSSLNIHSTSEFDIDVTGPDPNFVERNFEAEYEENMMRVLQDCSKEDLVDKCRQLMERVKELENRKSS